MPCQAESLVCSPHRMGLLYHGRRLDFRGQTLYPLNHLKLVYPDLYEREQAKYRRREAVPGFRIPGTCLTWADVVALSPIHPSRLTAVWSSVGMPTSRLTKQTIFAIPLERVASQQCIWFRNRSSARPRSAARVAVEPAQDDYELFDPAKYRELTKVPTSYYEYVWLQQSLGHRAYLFATIPHIFVAGPIDVSGLTPDRGGSLYG